MLSSGSKQKKTAFLFSFETPFEYFNFLVVRAPLLSDGTSTEIKKHVQQEDCSRA